MLESIRLRIGAALALLVAATFVGLAAGSLVVALVVASIAAAVLAVVLSAVVLTPLERITRTAANIAAGDLNARVSPRPSGALGNMADAFNQMARTLQEQIAHASRDHSRMVAALDSSADAVIALDDRDVIAFANPAAQHLLSRSLPGLIGNPFVWAIADAEVVEALRSSREKGESQRLLVERPAGRHLEVVLTPIVDGGDWASLVVFHDVTNVRRVEQVRRDFVANVSHELRTPLAALKSVIETLQAGAIEDPAATEEFLARGDEEIDRLVLMVEELLELSRIESGEMPLALQDVPAGDILAAAVDRMKPKAERHGLSLTLDAPDSLPNINADRNLLERAIVNLIDNAVKFTPTSGDIHVSARASDGLLTVDVRDTGEGIDPDDLPRVFERFYKADRARRGGGTGLGLAIVKHSIEAHGGSVSAQSEPGRGSSFTLLDSRPQRAVSLRQRREVFGDEQLLVSEGQRPDTSLLGGDGWGHFAAILFSEPCQQIRNYATLAADNGRCAIASGFAEKADRLALAPVVAALRQHRFFADGETDGGAQRFHCLAAARGGSGDDLANVKPVSSHTIASA